MQYILTAKIKVFVDKNQQALLDQTMEQYRSACNYVSNYIYRTHCLGSQTLNDDLYRTLREKFGLKAQMAQSVLRTVVAKYRTTLSSQNQWIECGFKKPQYDLVWNRDYSLRDVYFSVNTLAGRVKLLYVKVGMEKYFDSGVYKFGTAKLVKKKGKYFLHVAFTMEIDDPESFDPTMIVGIDRGINFMIATYDSDGKSHFVNGRSIKQKRAKYKQLRSELQHRGTASSRKRLKAIGQRENRWMQDVNHCIAKALVEHYPEHTLFVLEDLTGVRHATERVRRKDRYESVSWSFYDLEQKIKYKALAKGDLVINVDPHYTSQKCPICGHIKSTNRDKKNHRFCCKSCGYRSNDDRVAAMNLYNMGISYLADRVPAQ